MRSHSSCLFHTGQSLLVDFDLCASTRLVFFFYTGQSWWTLACALPLVLYFLTLVSRCWWTLTCALPLVLSVLTLVSRCWRTFGCAFPLVLSFLTLISRCLHHTILCCSYLQPHPDSLHIASIIQSFVFPTSSHTLTPYTLPPPYYPLLFLPPTTSWLLLHCLHHTVAPTSSPILAPDTLHPSYSPLTFLPPAISWLLTHCVHHTVPCLPYLQPHPGS